MDRSKKRLLLDYHLVFRQKKTVIFESKINLDIVFSRLIIMGEVGSGKSCLLKIIAGILQPQKCKVIFDGIKLQQDKIGLPLHLRKLCYLWQEPALFPHLSVQKNLLFSPLAKKSPLTEKLEEFFLPSELQKMPSELSGGEKQKVCLFQALLSQPQLLLLDEPFSSLDEKNKEKLLRFVLEVQKTSHFSLIYITHSKEEANILKGQHLFLEKGRIKNS